MSSSKNLSDFREFILRVSSVLFCSLDDFVFQPNPANGCFDVNVFEDVYSTVDFLKFGASSARMERSSLRQVAKADRSCSL